MSHGARLAVEFQTRTGRPGVWAHYDAQPTRLERGGGMGVSWNG